VDSFGCSLWVHNILTTVTKCIILSIRAQATLNHISICNFTTIFINAKENGFSEGELKKALYATLMWDKCCLGSYRQCQISQSDRDISSTYLILWLLLKKAYSDDILPDGPQWWICRKCVCYRTTIWKTKLKACRGAETERKIQIGLIFKSQC